MSVRTKSLRSKPLPPSAATAGSAGVAGPPAWSGAGRTAAFSLVEVTVALGVLAMIFAGLIGSILTAERHSVAVREHQAASHAALARLDQEMATDFTAFTGSFPVFITTGRLDASGTPMRARLMPAPNAFFPGDAANPTNAGHVTRTLNPEGNTGPDLMEIRVTVAWRCADGTSARVDVVGRRINQ